MLEDLEGGKGGKNYVILLYSPKILETVAKIRMENHK